MSHHEGVALKAVRAKPHSRRCNANDARREAGAKKSIDESYKELLTENDWPLFNVLRKWLAGRAVQRIGSPNIRQVV